MLADKRADKAEQYKARQVVEQVSGARLQRMEVARLPADKQADKTELWQVEQQADKVNQHAK